MMLQQIKMNIKIGLILNWIIQFIIKGLDIFYSVLNQLIIYMIVDVIIIKINMKYYINFCFSKKLKKMKMKISYWTFIFGNIKMIQIL